MEKNPEPRETEAEIRQRGRDKERRRSIKNLFWCVTNLVALDFSLSNLSVFLKLSLGEAEAWLRSLIPASFLWLSSHQPASAAPNYVPKSRHVRQRAPNPSGLKRPNCLRFSLGLRAFGSSSIRAARRRRRGNQLMQLVANNSHRLPCDRLWSHLTVPMHLYESLKLSYLHAIPERMITHYNANKKGKTCLRLRIRCSDIFSPTQDGKCPQFPPRVAIPTF